MAKNASIEQYVAILRAVQRFADGATLKEIGGMIVPPLQERDLREWIKNLATEGRVVVDGEYKFTRYRLAPGGLSGLEDKPNQPAGIPESGEGHQTTSSGSAPQANATESSRPENTRVADLAEAGQAGGGDAGYNKTAPVADLGCNTASARQTPYSAPVGGRTVPAHSTSSASRAGRGSDPRLPLRPAYGGQVGATPRPTSIPQPPPPPPPPPPPAPPPPPVRIVTDEEREKFKEYLDQMVPAIVRTEMKRGDARFYAGQAAEGLPRGDDDWFKEVIEAELDALDPAAAAAYGIAPAAFKKWRARW